MTPRLLARALRLLASLLGGLLAAAAAAQPAPPDRSYSLLYDVRIAPTQRTAHVTVRIGNGSYYVRSLRFEIDPERHRGFEGTGEIEIGPDFVEWQPPDGIGVLEYEFGIDHLRDERSYDARCGEDWAVFRGDDLVPRVRVRALVGAEADAQLRLRLPKGWSAATPYPLAPDGSFSVDQPDRRFDSPSGWIVAGRRLGVLREQVAGVQLAVAGPVGHGLRRLDLLALLRWTLPELRDVGAQLPRRLLVVGAGDPMWRGGLSGPNSLFIHADRPLITNDGTSPLLHELVHVVLRARGGEGGDWIVEGLAELYSLELLRRSRTISRRRYEKILRRLAEKGADVPSLKLEHATGPVVARAVTVLRELDGELRRRTDDLHGLDDVVRTLGDRDVRLTNDSLREIAESVAGGSLGEFFRRRMASDAGSE